MLYIYSDPHFGHEKVIKYNQRPFKTVEEMDEYLIEKWNETVRKKDEIIILGDFTLSNNARKYLDSLNGRIKVLENRTHHDRSWIRKKEQTENIELLPPIYRQKWYHQIYILCHFPIYKWENSDHGSFHLHGHSHGNLIYPEHIRNYLDCGVDSVYKIWGEYRPINLEEIAEYMRIKWTI